MADYFRNIQFFHPGGLSPGPKVMEIGDHHDFQAKGSSRHVRDRAVGSCFFIPVTRPVITAHLYGSSVLHFDLASIISDNGIRRDLIEVMAGQPIAR